jgi:hypothetical protein
MLSSVLPPMLTLAPTPSSVPLTPSNALPLMLRLALTPSNAPLPMLRLAPKPSNALLPMLRLAPKPSNALLPMLRLAPTLSNALPLRPAPATQPKNGHANWRRCCDNFRTPLLLRAKFRGRKEGWGNYDHSEESLG